MKIALVITVKNEGKLIRYNIEYHNKLGVDHTYLFLDGRQDDTPETINGIKNISIQNSVSKDVYQNNQNLKLFTENYETHFTARMSINAFHAQEMAKRSGFDW